MIVHIRAVAQQHEHQVRDGAEDGAVVGFELPDGFLDALSIGDVAADALKLDEAAVLVNDGMVDPVMPADRSIGHDDRMLQRVAPAGRSSDAFEYALTRRRGNQFDGLSADQFVPRLSPEATIRVVDEGQRRIRSETANQLALRVDNAPVTFDIATRLLFGAPPTYPRCTSRPTINASWAPKTRQSTDETNSGANRRTTRCRTRRDCQPVSRL